MKTLTHDDLHGLTRNVNTLTHDNLHGLIGIVNTKTHDNLHGLRHNVKTLTHDDRRGCLSVKYRVTSPKMPPTINANNFYMFSVNYFIFGAY